jgi:hypothetical protein
VDAKEAWAESAAKSAWVRFPRGGAEEIFLWKPAGAGGGSAFGGEEENL